MKTSRPYLLILGLVFALGTAFVGWTQQTPQEEPAIPEQPADVEHGDTEPADAEPGDVEPGVQPPPVSDSQPVPPEQSGPAIQGSGRGSIIPPEGSPPRRVPPSRRSFSRSNDGPTPPSTALADGEDGLRLNFRGVPLDMVLNYLSDAAGFIINLETEVRGTVDVWSNQPLTRDEAVQLLDSVLRKNGYAAIRQGRTLTIVSRDAAKTRSIPVITGNDPEEIPLSDSIVTQIIPVRFINAVQLVKDLQPLLPETAELTANEGGNALVLTDSQSNIRRMVEIVQALDTAIASVSAVRVFPLEYADAKALATTLTQLFQTQETSRNNERGGPGRFFNQFRRGDGNNQNNQQDPNGGRAPTPRVVAVADERSNSLVVSAPAEQMSVIEGIIADVDTDIEDITELRVFRLKHADPQETADLLSALFEDQNDQQNNRGRRFGGFNRGGRNNTADQSARMLQQTKVVAVPDHRTRSVVVTASRVLMAQIAPMIAELDADPARKQKVFVYSVENTDPLAVQEVLQSLFPEQNVGLNRNLRANQRENESLLNARQNQIRNQNTRNQSTLGGNLGTGNPLGTLR